MTEVNWAVESNGAHIAEASFEATTGLNGAANLLRPREDELWLTGVPPQHVTVALSDRHPPLHYAGWHVWLDSPTNPKAVEIASGPSLHELRPLLVCEALPGAGTQVWRLPHAIPAEHVVVRFHIMESFGPGPTYLNTLVLLEKDPGPDYNACDDAPPTTSVSLKEADAQYGNSAVSTPYVRRSLVSAAAGSGGGGSATERISPLPLERTPMSGPPPPPAGINVSASSRIGRYADDGGRSDVGVFVTTKSVTHDGPLQATSPTARLRSSRTRSPRERSSSSRMGQLLRDLDDDIRLLKPIKSLTPGKNMLMYLPQGQGEMPAGSLDGSDSEKNERNSEGRHRHVHVTERRSSEDGEGGSSRGGQQQRNSSSTASGTRVSPRLRPQVQPSPMEYRLHPDSEAAATAVQHSISTAAAQEARINALECAVAALNEAVQHQRDDLTMIKRLLLQQAAERRKEAEHRFEEKQQQHQQQHRYGAGNGVMMIPSPAAPLSPPPAPTAPAVVPDPRLTHRSITVDFPEDALRVFVEAILERRLRKHTKKIEAKMLERLDRQLHDVVRLISATIEGQQVANGSATLAGPSVSLSRTAHPEHPNALNHSGQVYSPLSQSSVTTQETPHHDRTAGGVGGGSAPFVSQQRGAGAGAGAASYTVHSPDASHTPVSQTETGGSAFRDVAGGNRVRGTL